MEELSIRSFHIDYLPHLACPTCGRGTLEVVDKLKHFETAETLHDHAHEYFDYDYVKLTVSGVLKCNNSRCSETVILSGKGKYSNFCDYNDPSIQGNGLDIYYSPIFFQPALNIIVLQSSVPESVRKMLKNSFSLFFCDDNACGNRIRASVEVMLDQLYGTSEKSANLCNRINKIQGLEENYKKQLTALRVLGNAATHGEGNLVREDNLNAYKLLASILHKFYPLDNLDDISKNLINAYGTQHDKNQLTDN